MVPMFLKFVDRDRLSGVGTGRFDAKGAYAPLNDSKLRRLCYGRRKNEILITCLLGRDTSVICYVQMLIPSFLLSFRGSLYRLILCADVLGNQFYKGAQFCLVFGRGA